MLRACCEATTIPGSLFVANPAANSPHPPPPSKADCRQVLPSGGLPRPCHDPTPLAVQPHCAAWRPTSQPPYGIEGPRAGTPQALTDAAPVMAAPAVVLLLRRLSGQARQARHSFRMPPTVSIRHCPGFVRCRQIGARLHGPNGPSSPTCSSDTKLSTLHCRIRSACEGSLPTCLQFIRLVRKQWQGYQQGA
jgi:hypothetical protein